MSLLLNLLLANFIDSVDSSKFICYFHTHVTEQIVYKLQYFCNSTNMASSRGLNTLVKGRCANHLTDTAPFCILFIYSLSFSLLEVS